MEVIVSFLIQCSSIGKETTNYSVHEHISERTGNVKIRNLPVRGKIWFILYQVVMYDALMSDLEEWICWKCLHMKSNIE